MRVERATEDDLEGVMLLENVLFENSFGEGTLRKELKAGYCAVLRDGASIMAYALVRPDPELHDLLRLGVMPGWQGRGYGSRLLDHVLKIFPGAWILMVRKNNARAQRLYETKGFRIAAHTDLSWVMTRPTR